MKKALLLLLLVFAMVPGYAKPLDFIVLLDVSESMLPHFDNTVNFLIRDILHEHLEQDDGFHLLSFASYPEIELIVSVKGRQDIQAALERVLLLQPLGRYTDLVSALKYVYSYVSSVRQNSRKKILVLTDGMHDPPPGSPYPVRDGKYQDAIAQLSQDIRKEGWDVGLVQIPSEEERLSIDSIVQPEPDDADIETSADADADSDISADVDADVDTDNGADADAMFTDARDDPATRVSDDSDKPEPALTSDEEGGVDLYTDLSENLGVDVMEYSEPSQEATHIVLQAPELFFPENLGKVRHRFVLPLRIKNHRNEKILVGLTEIIWNGVDILEKPTSLPVNGLGSRTLRAQIVLPDSTDPGEIDLELVAGFSDDLRIYPRSGTTRITLRATRNRRISASFLGYIAAAIGALVLLALVVFAARSLIQKTFIAAGNAPIVHGNIANPGDRAIEMYVEGQNSNIGLRNVHIIRDGANKSVGGGISTYLIYMYQFPIKIAEIRRNKDRYLFVPLKPDFCETTSPIEDCLEKEITIISASNRPVQIRFRRYVSALEKINKIMRLTDEPGPIPKSDKT